MKTTAEELVREAYSQGITDGHALNRAIGIPAQITVARALDAERAEQVAALKDALEIMKASEDFFDGAEGTDARMKVEAAIDRAEGLS